MSIEAFVFPPSPFSRALLFFMEEAQIDYTMKIINLRKGENKTEEYKLINPTTKTPAIRVDSLCIGETTTILKFLVDRFEKYAYFPEPATNKRSVADFWLSFVAHSVVPYSRELVWQRHLFPSAGRPVSKDLENRAEKMITKGLEAICGQLKKHEFICGKNISLADFVLTPAIEWHMQAHIDIEKFRGLPEWLGRMTSRPAWKKAEAIFNEFS